MAEDAHGVQRERQTTESNFTIVPNAIIRDGSISISAKMLAIYLLTHEAGYQVKFTQIERELGLGPKGFRSALKELQDLNLVQAERTKNSAGQWSTYTYRLSDLSRVPQGTVEQSTVEASTVAQGTLLRIQSLENTKFENTNRENRATKLPADWSPSEDLIEMFSTKWPSLLPEMDYHIEQFKLYWLGTGKPMKSWDLTFQKWMNTEQRRAPKRKGTDWEALDRWAREQDENEAL
jgi:hypothetical protein